MYLKFLHLLAFLLALLSNGVECWEVQLCSSEVGLEESVKEYLGDFDMGRNNFSFTEFKGCPNSNSEDLTKLIVSMDFSTFNSPPIKNNTLFFSELSTSAILHDGRLKTTSQILSPDQYCISRLENSTRIEVQICSPNCPTGIPCIPKCCGIDSILEYHGRTPTCKSLRNEKQKWEPFLYTNAHDEKINFDPNTIDGVRYLSTPYQVSQLILPCSQWQEKLPATDLRHIDVTWVKRHWKLLKDGNLAILENRRWKIFSNSTFCVDGLQANVETPFSGKESQQIVLRCPIQTLTDPPLNEEWKFLLYGILQFVATILYMFTGLCHILLVSKRTFHAWTIFHLILSLCLCSLFVGLRNIFDYVYATQFVDVIQLNTLGSFIFALLNHYFLLSTYCWFTTMSFSLLVTFRSSTRQSQTSLSKDFIFSCFTSWAFPAGLVVCFAAFDYIFKDPTSQVIIPQYGQLNYFIAPWAQTYYVYCVLLVLTVINLSLVIATVRYIIAFKKKTH